VTDVDVAVVGAGPAGTAAAIELAREGHTVTIVDKATFPRDKVCGDGLTADALRSLEALGLDPTDIPSWAAIDDIECHGPSGKSVRLQLPTENGIFAAVARRRHLDAALVERARAEGAEVIEGHAVTGVTAGGTHTMVSVGSVAQIRARHVIAADGMWSPVRKMIGRATPNYRGEWHAARQYFTGVTEQASRQLSVWFEADLLPGYAWSFPLGDGAVNVGFGVLRTPQLRGSDMNRVWRDLPERPAIRRLLGSSAQPEGTQRSWPIPARVGQLPLAAGNVLFVGDAAGVTDPMTGEGIGQALNTGSLAAHAIMTSDQPHRAGAHYRQLVTRSLVSDHRLARGLSAVLSRPIGVQAALRMIDLSPWTRDNFARWLFEDYPRAILLTPRRWRRPLLSGAGAYRPE